MIIVENLQIHSDTGQSLVNDLSFKLEAGNCIALVGESGAGKTLSAKALLGLLPEGMYSTASRFELFGQDAQIFGERDWRDIRGRHIGFIVQEALAALDPLRSIGREVAEPLEIHRMLPKALHQKRVLELMKQQDIPQPEQKIRQISQQLSGGQRQRSLIASVMAGQPRVIIADEPTASLDTILAAKQLEILSNLKHQGFGIVLISHNLAAVARLADEVIVLQQGRVIEQGSAALVLNNPQEPYTQELLAAARFTELTGVEPHQAGELKPVLAARGLSKSYGHSPVLNGIDVALQQGEVLGIAGESGSGKSTLARLLLGLEKPSQGEVFLFGNSWSHRRESDRRSERRRIQWIPQDPLSSFDPRWRVRRILAEALPRDLSRADRPEKLRTLMQQVELSEDLLDRRPLELSGGQRQRIAIARALATQPEILISDEAVSALDVTVQAKILQLLDRLRAELNLSLVFISHDLGVLRHFSDRLLILKDGKVVESGVTRHVLAKPQHPYTRELLAASLHTAL